MPENIKDFGMSVSVTVLWSASFVVVKYSPNLTDVVGFPATMFMFSLMCIVAEVLIIFYVPGTQGKSYEEIMDSLRNMWQRICTMLCIKYFQVPKQLGMNFTTTTVRHFSKIYCDKHNLIVRYVARKSDHNDFIVY